MNEFTLPFETPVKEIEEKINEIRQISDVQGLDLSHEVDELTQQLRETELNIYNNLDEWQHVQIARHPMRPSLKFYIKHSLDDFVELHGDRHFSDDPAIRCGFSKIGEQKFMLIGHFRGEETAEKIASHFGCAHPEGYRKALNKMKLAEKFGLPIVCLINTPGAYPGVGAEERNQSEALARNIMEMTHLKVPVYCIVLGEGGSGGALGIGIGDKLDLMEYSYFSVISPEGCAAILWKDSSYATAAAKALKCTAKHLKEFGIIDEIIPEPLGGAHRDPMKAARTLKKTIASRLKELVEIPLDELLKKRHERIRKVGRYEETLPEATAK